MKQKGQTLQKARLMEVSHLSIFGNVQVTSQAFRELGYRNIPVCHFTYGGWFSGITTGWPTRTWKCAVGNTWEQ